jgi:hypothetical protein
MSRPQPSESIATAFNKFDPFATHPFTSLQSPPPRNPQQFDHDPVVYSEQPSPPSSYNVHFTRAMNAPVQPLPSPPSDHATPSFTASGTSVSPNSSSPRPHGSQGHVFTDFRSELDRRLRQKGSGDDLPVLKKKIYVYDGF